MQKDTFATILTRDALQSLFPPDRTNDFFEALFGDAEDGASDIELAFGSATASELVMELRLHERPGCCLACNLTQGLPQVFSRHPIINVGGLVRGIDALLGDTVQCGEWRLGYTEQRSRALHVIPIHIAIAAV